MAHVLLVDDDTTTLESVAQILRVHDFDVTRSTSGIEALERIRQASFEVILVRRACDAHSRASVKDPRVRATLDIIGARYADAHLTAKIVARELGVSHEYLSRLIKTHTGHSFGYALNSARAARARELLLTSSFSVKEIAAFAGYRTTHHLDRYFRRRFGMTPTEMRRSEAR